MELEPISPPPELSLQPRLQGEGKNIYPVEFHGNAGEYFKIWIVNTVLSIITLWIYSAWAKVRKNRYLYGNTTINDSAFDYTANPGQILRGRLLALFLLIVYQFVANFWPAFGGVAFAVLVIMAPLFIVMSMRFRLRNTVWRNVNFHFEADGNVYRQAYFLFLPPILFFVFIAVLPFLLGADVVGWSEEMESRQEQFAGTALLTLTSLVSNIFELIQYAEETSPWAEAFPPEIANYFIGLGVTAALAMLLFPWWQAAYYHFIARNSYYGTEGFSMLKLVGKFYRMYIMLIIYSAVILGLSWLLSSILPVQFTLFIGAFSLTFVYAFLFGFVQARRTNIVYSNLSIADVEVESNLNGFKMTWLYISNTLAILCTLGLAIPWATIRVARYRAECMQLLANDLDDFSAQQARNRSAIGEEVGDMFGFDLGL